MMTPATNKEWTPSNFHKPTGSTAYAAGFPKGDMSYMDASRTTTDSRDEASLSVSNASEMESEWVEQDEPGVYITIRQLVDGTRELRRVRFRYLKISTFASAF